jgi:hypothetical protein
MGLAVFLALGTLVVVSVFTMRLSVPDRSEAVVEQQVVINNLGQRERSRPFRLASRFSPLLLSSSDGTDPKEVENVLIFEDYPLIPVCVCGPWISPGEIVSIWVWKDQGGNVLAIELDR